MTEISQNELRRIDFTLLLVFLAVMRHRKSTTAASELGLTQSAISQSLQRLRDIFRDPLFLRRPHGMEPTAAAQALEPLVSSVVETLRGALGASRSFKPDLAQGVIRIAAYDAELAVLFPPLVGRLQKLAPGLRLAGLGISRSDALDALAEGAADLALGYFRNPGKSFLAEMLYDQDYRVVGRKGVLPAGSGISLKQYAARDHILVSPAGDLRGVVDDALEAQGLSRTVIASLPQFLPALAALQDTGAIATLPARVVARYASGFRLRSMKPPLAIRSFTISAVRHRRNENSPMHVWLTSLLKDVSAQP